ncbi:MAG: hypothetical protein NTX24_03050 [Candidatus Pacearchaeota archaeon]|nr:hypothetical protein [Candidatus Pacearchaeota archaeon]
MKKSKKKVSGRYNAPMPSAMPKQGTPVFAVASIVFGAIFLFTLGFMTYGNLTGQAIFSTSSSSGGTSDISALNATCYDSDGSLTWPDQYFIRGYCIDSTTNVSKWDFCNSTTTCFEYYCNYQRKCAGINMNCANLNESTGQCSNGACVRKYNATLSSSSSGGALTFAGNGTNCTDSDGGIMVYIPGNMTYNGTKYIDTCWNTLSDMKNVTNSSKTLDEFYCDSTGRGRRATWFCIDGCKDGACISGTGVLYDLNRFYGGVMDGGPPRNCGYLNYDSGNACSDHCEGYGACATRCNSDYYCMVGSYSCERHWEEMCNHNAGGYETVDHCDCKAKY